MLQRSPRIRILFLCISFGPDKAKNLEKARQKALQAASEGASLIILPECFNSPYSTAKFRAYAEPLSESPDPEQSPSFFALAQMARDTGAFIIGGTVPERDESGKIYNTSAVYSPHGKLLASHRKMHLFDIDVPGGMCFRESETLSPGNKITLVELEGYGTIGLGICYDMRFAEFSTIAARKGAFALVYPSAFNTTTGPLHWELLGRARAVDNQVYTILCSQARDPDSSYPAWGYSMVADPMGQVVVVTEEKEDIVYAVLDPNSIVKSRMAIPITYQRRHDVYPDIGQLVRLDK
ncbi:Carbon-nitrogen hydrolase [Aspergillus hancockii]|nr:Carbon-nitrogen hydrolase [Aspergillus hancockii]